MWHRNRCYVCIREKNSLSRELASARGNEKKQRDNGGITREILIKRVRERDTHRERFLLRERMQTRGLLRGATTSVRAVQGLRGIHFSPFLSPLLRIRASTCVLCVQLCFGCRSQDGLAAVWAFLVRGIAGCEGLLCVRGRSSQ